MHSMWSFTETTHEVNEDDLERAVAAITAIIPPDFCSEELFHPCLLYTSDAADE